MFTGTDNRLINHSINQASKGSLNQLINNMHGVGKFIQSFGEDHQVVKSEKEYHGFCDVEKRERGSIFIFPIILRQLRRLSSGEEEQGTEILGKKIKI